MLPYAFILILVCLCISVGYFLSNRQPIWLPLIALVIFAAARSYTVGTDSVNYVANFLSNTDPNYITLNPDIEIGYQIFEKALLYFTHEYYWLFFITAFFIIFSYLVTLKKYSNNYFLSVYIYITFGTYAFFFNTLRQGIAMAIIVLATPLFLQRKTWTFILATLFASLFHMSALGLIPLYFLVHMRINPLAKIIGGFTGSALFSYILIDYLASYNKRYIGYTEELVNSGGYIIISFYSLLMLITYILIKILKVNDDISKKLLVFLACGIAVTIPIAFLGTNPSGPLRFLNYFLWPFAILIPTILQKLNSKIVIFLFLIIAFIYYALIINRFSDLIPYQINPVFKVF